MSILDAFLTLPRQLETSFGVAASGPSLERPRSIVLCGMGGSAAAGDVLRAAYADALPAPALSVRGDRLPGYLGPDDLVVCLSYSGTTEETLSAFDEAAARGCALVAVCAGGGLADRAAAAGATLALVPRDVEMPRAALGLLTGALVGTLARGGLLPGAGDDVRESVASLTSAADELAADAAAVARRIGARMPVIWGSEGPSEAAAWRWKCAFNENAKTPAFSSSLPELDHHEVVGWAEGTGPGFVLIVLREAGEQPGIARRIEATLETIAAADLGWMEVHARGASALARTLSRMLVGDVASATHALERGIDPEPIEAIASLKQRLGRKGAR